MSITQRVGREIKRQIRRVTRQVMGMTAGWESDDPDEETMKNYADDAQTRPRSESWTRAPSPGPMTRQASLPDLREISTRPQVDVEKFRRPFGEVQVRPARAPEPRRAREPTPVEPPENVRTTETARDMNGNRAGDKMNLAVSVWDIKPRYRLVEPRPRVSITQCRDNISDVVRPRKSSG